MANNIYQMVDTQVYDKNQVMTRIIAIEHDVAHHGSGIVLKSYLRSGKWYLKIHIDASEAMDEIIDLVKHHFVYSYSTSGNSYERTMRIGSTAKRTAELIAKQKEQRRSHTLRTALFNALWVKFVNDQVDFDVDYVSNLVDVVAAVVTKHQTK